MFLHNSYNHYLLIVFFYFFNKPPTASMDYDRDNNDAGSDSFINTLLKNKKIDKDKQLIPPLNLVIQTK